MSVVKSKRKSTRFEVAHLAFKIRTTLQQTILIDYGVMENKQLDESTAQLLRESAPHLVDYAREISNCIQYANAIYGVDLAMMDERRKWQDHAIANCHCLLQECQYIIDVFHEYVNVNKYTQITELVHKEIELLRNWRRSDNKIRRQLVDAESDKFNYATFCKYLTIFVDQFHNQDTA